MELNKDYGIYLEIKNIEDKDEKYEFNELLDVLITGESLHKDIDGWYYPDTKEEYFQERCGVFAYMIDSRLKQYHKYINQLLFKKNNEIIDWKQDAIDANDW
ncbi:MAG: hypothetical protein LBB39_02140 [Mycoplasmataceae bacterium]|nr:hypothetical protein [Mycoplasmataceae bacterium]